MNNNKTTIRAFLALELPERIKEQISNLYSPLKSRFKINIKWVRLENLHITIKFLGNIQEETLAKIIRSLQDLNLELNTNLFLNSCGVFPPKGFPRVFWVSFEENPDNNQLIDLNNKIEKGLRKLGFPEEKRRFKPHVTIARLKLKNKTHVEEFDKMFEIFNTNFGNIEKESFAVNRLTLFKSELTPQGAKYSKIEEF